MARFTPSFSDRLHPLQVYCGGWKSDTVTLERAGWRFHLTEESFNMTYRIVMMSPYQMRYMIAFDEFSIDHVLRAGFFMRGDPFDMVSGSPRLIKAFHEATPLFMEDSMHAELDRIRNGEYFQGDLFPNSPNPTFRGEKEIILPDEQTVDELLDIIIAKQIPEQKAIRERFRKREKRQASIITLEDAA